MTTTRRRAGGGCHPLGPTMTEWNDARHRAGYIPSPSTYRAARWHIRRLTDYLGADTDVADITTDDLHLWIECLAEDGLQPRSRNQVLGTIRRFFGWAAANGLTTDNPMAPVHNVKAPHRNVRAVPPHHVSLILDHADLRTRTIIVLLAQIGFRRGELAGIRWEQYDEATGVLLIEQGKGCRDRTVVLEREPAEALAAWRAHLIEKRRPADGPLDTGPVFPGRQPDQPLSPGRLYTIVTEAAAAVGLHYTPHQYRHTCGTEWTRRGVPSITLARQLGHVDVNTTAVYADNDVEALRPHVAPARYYRGTWRAPIPSR